MPAELRDWIVLLKPRVISLVVFTGAVGLIVAPGPVNPVLAFTAILCIAVGAGASGAINMWYDRDIDAVMRRTAGRPVAAGRIAPGDALGFGVFLAVASVLVLYLATSAFAAAILTVSILFYVFVYTMWLKRRTPQNIVIGGAAGAFPPLIGGPPSRERRCPADAPIAIVFFWTPPHFWALSLYAHSGLQTSRCADAPGRRGAHSNPAGGPGVYRAAGRGVVDALGVRVCRANLWIGCCNTRYRVPGGRATSRVRRSG